MGRGNNIALVMSSLGKTQTDKFTPLPVGELDLRLNVTSRNWVETVKTIEDIFDCVGEDIVSREVTRVIRRLPIEGEFVPVFCAPLMALAWGGAASPAIVVPANEVATVEVVNADGGSFKLRLDYDGIDQTTVSIPYGASAALFKSLIEDLDNIGYGNTSVVKAGDLYTITFTGKRGFADIPLFTLESNDLTGVGADVNIAETTAGAQRSHNITEMSGYSQPMTTFGIAFEDEPGSERLMVGATIENFNVTGANNNGKVTFSAEIVSRDLIVEPTLVIPECVTYRPIRTADCILTRNSEDLTEGLRDFALNFSNNTLTGNTAYTGRSVKPTRLERSNRRTRSLSYTLIGASQSVTSPLYLEAINNPEADIKRVTSLRIGVAGNNVTVNIPNALTELATGSGGINFDNESEEALNRYIDTPTKVGGVAPTNLVAKVSQSGTFLEPVV